MRKRLTFALLLLPALTLGVAGCASPNQDPSVAPEPPQNLVRYLTGNATDASVSPAGPGLLLMGGGADVDASFLWASSLANGGDVVVLRASGSDGYNDYLYREIGGFDSVETLMVTSRQLADSEYVAWAVAHAELVFLAGGDQWNYVDSWKASALTDSIETAWQRGAVIGGTSAGLAVLGETIFGAKNGGVTSQEVLGDPFHSRVQLDRDFLSLPPLAGVLTDSHFASRDRMGRLIGFLARVVQDGWATDPVGLGIDAATAVLVEPDGSAQVVGSGNVYVVRVPGAPQRCEAGQALEFAALRVQRNAAGTTLTFPGALSSEPVYTVNALAGVLDPTTPY